MAKMPSMRDTLHEEGYWWRPEHPDNKVPGTLTFNQEEGARLALLGLIGRIEDSFNPDYSVNVIHGFTKSGKPVSLLRSIQRGRQIKMPGITTESYSANLLAIGYHFTSQDEAIFSGAWFRFGGIEQWLEHEPYDLSLNQDTKHYLLDISRTGLTPVASWGDCSLLIGSNMDTKQTGTDYQVSVESMIGIRTIELRSLNWFHESSYKIANLASLSTGKHLPQLMLRLEGPRQNIAPGINPITDVDIYVQLTNPSDDKAKDEPIISGATLIAHDSACFEKWFEEYENLKPVMDLFFAVTGTQDMFLNVRFLLSIQALEAFHRAVSSDPLIKADEHLSIIEAMKAAIPDNTPKAMQEKLEGMLKYSNEPSLSQRLKALMTLVVEKFGGLPAGYDKAFVRSLVDTRNYNTHHTEELASKALEGADLYWAHRRMILLLTMLLLMRIGVPADHLKIAIARHREFSQLWNRPGRPK